jgi:hypothetical protein
MSGQGDPFTTASLVGFIALLLGIIYRELRGQIADRDKIIEKQDRQLEASTNRTSSLAATSERMLQYFLDREERKDHERSTADRGASP